MPHIIYDKTIIEILVLFLLQHGELYAYSIMKLISSLSEDTLSVMGGSLYPILYKLKDKGYITDRIEIIGKRQRMSRVYYNLTASGQEYLQTLLADRAMIQNSMEKIFKNAEGDVDS